MMMIKVKKKHLDDGHACVVSVHSEYLGYNKAGIKLLFV